MKIFFLIHPVYFILFGSTQAKFNYNKNDNISTSTWQDMCGIWEDEYSNYQAGLRCPVSAMSKDPYFQIEFKNFNGNKLCLRNLPLRRCVTVIPDGMPIVTPKNRAEDPPAGQINWKKFPTTGVLKADSDPSKVFASMRIESQGDCKWCFNFALSNEDAYLQDLIDKYKIPMGTPEVKTFLDLGGGSGSIVAAAAAKFSVQGITVVRDNHNIPFAEVADEPSH